MRKRYHLQIAIHLFLFTSTIIVCEAALAQTPAIGDAAEYISPQGALGVGWAAVNFDTKLKLTDKTRGVSVFLDPEGNLDLPEAARVNIFYATYRIGKRHNLEAAHFAVKRESTFFSEQINLEDVIIANGRATLSDDTKFYLLNYSYALFQDNRSSVNGLLGISGLDLKYTLEASGELIIDGERQFDTYYDEASIFAPLPLLGFNFYFAFTRKWSLRNNIAFVGGRYEDIRAGVVQASINANYWFTKHVGGVLGLATFNARVVVEDEKKLQEIDYGYAGVYAGLHFAF
ncbi:MAG: hypothetical protein AMJ53_01855 [Gammaproteobacteria bacterium SG8_11]|nr:MAG: hypothetical protein AMJ53_01855 [Gammaproteobacteria bacterium SG8_11]